MELLFTNGKNRAYGDRGTGFTPRLESVPGTKNEKNLVAVQDGVKDVDVMYLFKNTTYIYADNVSEKLQLP